MSQRKDWNGDYKISWMNGKFQKTNGNTAKTIIGGKIIPWSTYIRK